MRRALSVTAAASLLVTLGSCSDSGDREAQAPAPPSAMPAIGTDATAIPERQIELASDRPELAPIGDPTAPLPKGLALPAEIGARAASVLAAKVLAGTSEALPALLTALQLSGVAVLAPDGSLAVTPAEPWRGVFYESWEVRPLLNLVHPRHTIVLDPVDVGDTIRALAPELADTGVEKLIADDICTLAAGPESPTRFLANFILELGRQSGDTGHDELGTMNGMQTSLVLHMLAAELSTRAGPAEVAPSVAHIVPDWLIPAAHAESGSAPCTMNKTEKLVMDIASLAGKVVIGGIGMQGTFEGAVKAMEKAGVDSAKAMKTFRTWASLLLSYAKFMYTYVALDARIEMPGDSLRRTRQVRPKTGEKKELTLTVTMDIGNKQMVNCFRIMFNSVGLDFTLPGDGPVKNARVAWYAISGFDQVAALRGGPENIVQFVDKAENRIQGTGDPSTGINAISNQVTDANGQAHIDVEGVGQRRVLTDTARPVNKEAAVAVNIAVKGSDLWSDAVNALATAASGAKALLTAPLDILLRAKWATVGHYTFTVVDWSSRGAWSGSVGRTVVTTGADSASGEGSSYKVSDLQTLTTVVNVTSGVTTEGSGADFTAMLEGTTLAEYSAEQVRLKTMSDPKCTKKSVLKSKAQGEATGPAVVRVAMSDDGRYRVTVGTGVTVEYKGQGMVQADRCLAGGGVKTTTEPLVGTDGSAPVDSFFFEATIDPEELRQEPLTLMGKVQDTRGNLKTGQTSTTIAWRLTRE